ncbi:MAG: MFS transporter [Fidelibacterota bacterium]
MPRSRETKVIRSSLKVSTIEGSWWAVMYGTAETYFGAFFEFLKYSSYEISILTTLPILIGSIFQSYANLFFHLLRSRKILLIILKLFQNLLIPTIFYVGIKTDNFNLFLVFLCLYFVIAISMMSPWTSWMGYLVPSRMRGRYFGNRSQIVKVFMLISSLLAGTILNAYTDTNPIIGFGIIFTIGFLANFGSIFYLFKQFEPPYETIEEIDETLNLNELRFKGIKKFITYDSLSEFAFNISGPLMMVFWLREQKFNYIELAILINVSQVLGLFSLRYWGRKIDELGTFTTIRWTSLAISIFPLLWFGSFFLPQELKLPISLVIASIASLMFSGRALAMDNRLFEHMVGKNMIKLTSKRILYRGIFIFIGGILGGLMTKQNFQIFTNSFLHLTPILIVFIFSTLIRLSVWFTYLRTNNKTI